MSLLVPSRARQDLQLVTAIFTVIAVAIIGANVVRTRFGRRPLRDGAVSVRGAPHPAIWLLLAIAGIFIALALIFRS